MDQKTEVELQAPSFKLDMLKSLLPKLPESVEIAAGSFYKKCLPILEHDLILL
jgi:hypothetical protein